MGAKKCAADFKCVVIIEASAKKQFVRKRLTIIPATFVIKFEPPGNEYSSKMDL